MVIQTNRRTELVETQIRPCPKCGINGRLLKNLSVFVSNPRMKKPARTTAILPAKLKFMVTFQVRVAGAATVSPGAEFANATAYLKFLL
jgi:hypothetical protein